MGANLLPCNAAAPVASPDDEAQISGRALNRLMAKIIEFYIPNFREKWRGFPRKTRAGKVIEFCSQLKKSA